MEKPAGSVEYFLNQEIRDLHAAGKQLMALLHGFGEAARDCRLKHALCALQFETSQQLERLENAAAHLGFSPSAGQCRSISFLCGRTVEEQGGDTVSDLSIVAAVSRIVHYEIAGFRLCSLLAEAFGVDAVSGLLCECLWETRWTEKSLCDLAARIVHHSPEGERSREQASRIRGERQLAYSA